MNSMPRRSLPLPPAVPAALRESPLMKAGGCAIYDHFPGGETCKDLLEESRRCLPGAEASARSVSDQEEIRGGKPARQLISTAGGSAQTAFYHDPGTAAFLTGICNSPVTPTGSGGTYSYYARPGDHLALHRDIHTCDVAVITCLLDRHHEGSEGGFTRYYPSRQHEPLSRIRAAPALGALDVRLPAGSTMVMFGGLIPHLILPVGAGEIRIVSLLCFRAHCGE